MAGPTESPFVFERDGRWYLLIGPDWDTLTPSFEETGRYDLRAYRRTRVLVSDDPLAFDLADQVGDDRRPRRRGRRRRATATGG